MFSITEKKLLFKIYRYYFADELTDVSKNGDIVMVHGNKTINCADKNSVKRQQNTLITDLKLEFHQLLEKINKNYRYEIRRAEKENIECRIFDCKEITEELKTVIKEFEECYGKLFKSKGLNGRFNRWLINELINAQKITISVASYQGENLCYHAYIQDFPCTELMYSVSKRNYEGANKNLIGYANKYLHWKDFEFFKNSGYEVYDWGGVGDLENVSGIAAFKLAFGGDVTKKVSYIFGRTLLGKMALKVKGFKRRKK